MNCRDVEKFTFAYLDEEFAKSESLAFEAHVSQCSECRAHVREEEHFRRRLRNQLRHTQAPDALRARVRAALADEQLVAAALDQEHSRAYGARPSHRLWMGGALAAGLAAIAVWTGASSTGPLLSGGDPVWNAASSVVPLTTTKAADPVAVPAPAPRPDPLDATLEDTASVAIQLHRRDLPLDVQGEHHEVERFLRRHLGASVVPPIPESCTTRLIGARVIGTDSSPVVQFVYDHHGRRLSALQRVLPQSEPTMVGMHRIVRRHGYNTLVVGQTESLLTTVVTDMPSRELSRLVVAGGYSR